MSTEPEVLISTLRSDLQEGPRLITSAVSWVPAHRLTESPPQELGTWSVHRHVFHLLFNQSQRGIPRIKRVLDQTVPVESRDEHILNEDARWDPSISIDVMIMGIQAERSTIDEWLSHVPPNAWTTSYREEPYGETTLLWYVQKLHQHTIEHVDTILRIGLFWNTFSRG